MRLAWIEKNLYYGCVQATYLLAEDGQKFLDKIVKYKCQAVLGSVLGKHSDISFDVDASCVRYSEELSDEFAEQLLRVSEGTITEDEPWHQIGGNVDILGKMSEGFACNIEGFSSFIRSLAFSGLS